MSGSTTNTIGLRRDMGTRWRPISDMRRRRMDRRAGMRSGVRVAPSIFIRVYWGHLAHGRKMVTAC